MYAVRRVDELSRRSPSGERGTGLLGVRKRNVYGDGRGGKCGELERPKRGLVVPEKAEACCILPLGTTAHTTSGDARTSETEVSGSDDGNAHTSVDIATHLGVRLIPFRSDEGRQLPKQGFRFLAEKTISGYHKRRKITSLLAACREVLFLFLAFVGLQDLVGVFGEVGPGIRVGDSDINDTIGSPNPQTTDQEVTAVIAGGLHNGGIRLGQGCLLLCGAT